VPGLDEKGSELKAKTRTDWDYVGKLDDRATETEGIAAAGDCEEVCKVKGRGCLACTWDGQTQRCAIAS
jgi:hypothetical protein